MTMRVIAVALAVALWSSWPQAADAAFVGKRAARAYLVRALPAGAPRVLLHDERSAFFHTAQSWVEPASRCHRRAADGVSCRMRTLLEPDAAHRKGNWWPISCRGAVLVRRLADGRLKGSQLDYTCRTVRP